MFIHFFQEKNAYFRPIEEDYSIKDFKDQFLNGKFLGEMDLPDGNFVVFAFLVKKELSERSGNKSQYELAKKILKELLKDTGIFIFYDEKKDFRFFLVFAEFYGTKRTFSHYKRYTYFVSSRLTNKIFVEQIQNEGDFSSIERIKLAFDVEPVTKQFYEEIQSWYFMAMDQVEFP